MTDEARKHIEELLSSEVIRKSKSPWCSNVVLVRNKNGKLRLCVDYRMLNKKTVKDLYALPRVEEIFDVLNGSKLFSTIDISSSHRRRVSHVSYSIYCWPFAIFCKKESNS